MLELVSVANDKIIITMTNDYDKRYFEELCI